MARSVLVGVSLGLLLLLAGLAHASAAKAYDITSFLAGTLNNQDDNTSYFQTAGGRPPFGVTDFSFATNSDGEPVGNTKNIRVDIPAGLIPNPQAFTQCTDTQLAAQACPKESQIGIQRLRIRGTVPLLALLGGARQTLDVQVPLYNMTLSGGQIARFAFNPREAPGSGQLDGNLDPINIVGGMRASDNGLYFTISNLPQDPATVSSRLIFWGVPGASGNDADRGRATTKAPYANVLIQAALAVAAPDRAGGKTVAAKTTAFLSNPTSCAGVQTSTLQTESYAGDTRSASYTTPVGVNSCDQVPFAPTTTYGTASINRDSPTALDVGLQVPQSQTTPRATAHVKRVQVTLPPGFSISPSAANGLETCTDAQLAKGTTDPVACPAGSKVGSVTIKSPALANPLTGGVYLGEQQPGNRYRLFLDAEGPGVIVRLKGTVTPDPTTGQLTTVFDDNPQLPFSDLDLHFDGGPRAIIASPQTCGTATGSSTYSPWSGAADVTSSTSIAVTGCDGFPFSPGFSAGLASYQSGASSPFTATFTRDDGNQYLGAVNVTLPPGLIAKLKGVPQCSEAQIGQQACPANTQVGVVATTAGPGPAPYALNGSVYFTGGYKGAPFGMVAIIHVVAGPYDLGNVVVRQAIQINPDDAHVTVVSDPLPQILEGIPLRIRSLALTINRPGFMRSPTSCGPGLVSSETSSANGAQARPTATVTFTGCQSLAFKPKLQLAFGNRTQMKKFKHPSVTATLTQPDGQSDIKGTSVALPKAVALAADNAQGLCDTAVALADKCPKASIVGSASAVTPILNKTLSGPVYFVKGERTDPKTGIVIKTLPTLFIPLRGEATIYLRPTTAISHNRLVTTFASIPDAPISKFTLKINGGAHGIIASTRDLCSSKSLTASAQLVGYNNVKLKQKPKIGVACGVSPRLRLAAPKRSGKTLKVSGSVAKAAKKAVKVSVVCGKTKLSASGKPKKGHWSTTVRLTKGCASGRSAKVTATYPGDSKRRPETSSARTVKLR